MAIAQAKVKTLSSEVAAVKKQSNFDKEMQEQTIVELRKDNAMLKGEMDELRQVVQALANANKERKPQLESPAKPGPLLPEPPVPEEKPGMFPVGEPRSLGPLRTEGSVPATVNRRWFAPRSWRSSCENCNGCKCNQTQYRFPFNVFWNRGGCNRETVSFNRQEKVGCFRSLGGVQE